MPLTFIKHTAQPELGKQRDRQTETKRQGKGSNSMCKNTHMVGWWVKLNDVDPWNSRLYSYCMPFTMHTTTSVVDSSGTLTML